MKKVLLIGLIASSILISGCGNKAVEANKMFLEAKVAIENGEYETAKALFKLISNEEGENKEHATEMYITLENYLKAKQEFLEENYDEVKSLLDEINNLDKYETLKNDVTNLKKEIPKINEEDIKEIVQEILDENNLGRIYSVERTENFESSIDELNGKDLFHITEVGLGSPREYYYDEKSKKLYKINQGMWFIVNENFKIINPKDSDEYEWAQEYRKGYLENRIVFTREEAMRIAQEKAKEYDYEVLDADDDKHAVVGKIKLYRCIVTSKAMGGYEREILVGSDKKIYNFRVFEEDEKLAELTVSNENNLEKMNYFNGDYVIDIIDRENPILDALLSYKLKSRSSEVMEINIITLRGWAVGELKLEREKELVWSGKLELDGSFIECTVTVTNDAIKIIEIEDFEGRVEKSERIFYFKSKTFSHRLEEDGVELFNKEGKFELNRDIS